MLRMVATLVMALSLLALAAPAPHLHAQPASSNLASATLTARPLPNDAGLGYYEYLPDGYGSGARWPLIVFFHGIDERGNGASELSRVLRVGLPRLLNAGQNFPAIIISPQLATSYGSWQPSITTPFVNYLLEHYDVDIDRIYITGLSLGGGGTWLYAKNNPGLVAAIVPICGNESSTGLEVLRGKPIWAFHNSGDPRVALSSSTSKLRVITGVDPQPVAGQTGAFNGTSWTWRPGQSAPPAGENPIFTVYASSSHDAWTAAYNNTQMWDWLFQQRRPSGGGVVLQQDFQSSTSVGAYVNATSPGPGQFNDISAEATGGTWSISNGRLQLVRAASTGADNGAGITRHTDFAGPPAKLHVAFDLGVSGWTASPFQSGALELVVGNITSVRDYNDSDPTIGRFQTLAVKGRGVGQFAVVAAGVESAARAADGTLHRIELFLNKSGAAASYRAPNGTLRSVPANGMALWVAGALVVETAAANGSSSTLTDLRLRFVSGDNATWQFDNITVRNTFPQ